MSGENEKEGKWDTKCERKWCLRGFYIICKIRYCYSVLYMDFDCCIARRHGWLTFEVGLGHNA